MHHIFFVALDPKTQVAIVTPKNIWSPVELRSCRDKCLNFFCDCQVRLPPNTSDDVDEDPTGNKALWDRGLLNGASQKVKPSLCKQQPSEGQCPHSVHSVCPASVFRLLCLFCGASLSASGWKSLSIMQMQVFRLTKTWTSQPFHVLFRFCAEISK